MIKINLTKIDLNDSNTNKKLAEICGIHVGDGYLRNDGRRREWDISGSIEEKEYYDKHMIPLFNDVFELSIKGRFFPHRNTYGFVIRDKNTIEFAHQVLGFPYGDKSTIISVPQFILKDNILVINFLRGYFDTDGHFSCVKKYGNTYREFKRKFHYYPRLVFSTVSSQLSYNLGIIFKTLQMNYYFHNHQPPKKTESLKYIYEIKGPDRANRFMHLVQPKNTTKTTRYAIWHKFGFCPTNISFQQRLDILSGKVNPYKFYRACSLTDQDASLRTK